MTTGRAWCFACAVAATMLLGACRKRMTFDGAETETELQSIGDRTPWEERSDECREADDPLTPNAQWSGLSYDRIFSPSRSGRIRLQMPDSEDDEGWILFGNYDELPAPLPGEACYPSCAFRRSLQGGVPTPVEGFMYPLRLTSSVTRGRQRLSFDLYAPWAPWCEQQDPIAFGQAYVCAPRNYLTIENGECVLMQDTGQSGPLDDCCREILCNQLQVCRCDADQCAASEAKAYVEVIVYADKGLMILELNSGGLFLLENPELQRMNDPDGGVQLN